MSILQIELADEQLQLINEHARARGYTNNGEFLLALWEETAEQQNYMRERGLTREQLQHEEQQLLQSLDSEPEQVDDAWWDKLHADVLAKVAAKKHGGEAEKS